MKIGFFIIPIVALLAQVYVLWHVYQVLPFPTWAKWTVVALMVAALTMMFIGIFVFLLLSGPGKISLDYIIAAHFTESAADEKVIENA